MHILFVYQYYHNLDCPASGRHYQFIKALSKKHKISILTSNVWEKKRSTRLHEWVPEGTELYSFDIPYDNAMSSGARFRSFARFVGHAVRKGLSIPKPDVIFGTSTPLTAAWAASIIASVRNIPWVFEVRDLWPDFPIQMGAIGPAWLKKALYRLEHSLYKSAAHVITLSPDMEQHVLSRGTDPEKVTTLVNGTDLSLARSVDDSAVAQLKAVHQLEGKNIVLYAGTFGRANAIPTLIETANLLQEREDIHFVFLGAGFFEGMIHEAMRERTNVTLVPPVPRHTIFHWFKLADVSLVPFIDLPVLKTNSPAKFFDSLATGTPVIVTNSGWTRSFVEDHQCGWYAPIEEPGSIARTILDTIDKKEVLHDAGLHGYRAALAQFDRMQMLDPLEDILHHSAHSEQHKQLIPSQ